MKKIIPFKKELFFKENIYDISSISLEHSIHPSLNNEVTGEFYLNGTYKVTEESLDVSKFEFNIPFDINIDEKYNIKDATIDINDFYYEIINSNALTINIELLIDKLEEMEIKEEEIRCIEEEENELKDDTNFNMLNDNDFNNALVEDNNVSIDLDDNKKEINISNNIEIKDNTLDYRTYKVYIVKEEDSIESICMKYETKKDILEKYNNINNILVGDKIIIPSND